jgi:hypothetical protein
MTLPMIFQPFFQIFIKFFFSNFLFFIFFNFFFEKSKKSKISKNPKKSNKSMKVAFSNFFFDIYVHEIGCFSADQRRLGQKGFQQ